VRRSEAADVLGALPPALAELAGRVVAAADESGLALYLVGGPVRDWLLGRALRDVDLVMEPEPGGADAPVLAKALAPALEAAGARVTRHDRFGTLAVARDGIALDVTTARRERYAHDGALPDVAPGGLEEDLLRRDFAVNAIALPLSRAARARHAGLVDPAHGVRDLERRALRILHRRSFHDDPTRALRAARLAPRLGFSLSRDSRNALRAALRDGAFGRVSGERLRRELVKLFDEAALGLDPAAALRLLDEWHVLGALEPGLALPREAVAPLRRLGRALGAPPWGGSRWRPWVAGLSLWLAPVAAALRRRTLARFAVRGEAAARVVAFPRARDAALRSLARARGRGALDAALAPIDEETIQALFASAEPPQRRRVQRWALEDRGRRAPVGGADLVALGFSGPAVGRALARIRAAFLDRRVDGRDEALALARELLRRRGAAAGRSPEGPPAT
jgi:tRNA nucleotidyltransferase (CCA-adding enzyme)